MPAASTSGYSRSVSSPFVDLAVCDSLRTAPFGRSARRHGGSPGVRTSLEQSAKNMLPWLAGSSFSRWYQSWNASAPGNIHQSVSQCADGM
eukprot:scaffold21331_cov117-Isochrysis_galbana.AAC.5